MDIRAPEVEPCARCGTALPPAARRVCPRCAFRAANALAGPEAGADTLVLDDIPGVGETLRYVGDYEILEVIARGGMGVVYRARQRSLNRVVALKMLLGGGHAGEEYKRRFRQEAETAAKLQHPNIVPIYETGEHLGQPYFSMEYVAGTDLGQRTRDRPLPPEEAARLVQAVAAAIEYAHRQGVLHRDLKPSNILVGADGRPRITDFGLARHTDLDSSLTLTGATLGTPGYLPPEQVSVKRGQAGPPSDVYALGGLLYHLLTGRAPFQAASVAEALQQVLWTEPAPPGRIRPGVPKDLETICLKCLRKDPARRYASARALADDLGRWLQRVPILARPVPRLERAIHWSRRHPAAAALAAVLALLATLGAVGFARQAISSNQARALAPEFRLPPTEPIVTVAPRISRLAPPPTTSRPPESNPQVPAVLSVPPAPVQPESPPTSVPAAFASTSPPPVTTGASLPQNTNASEASPPPPLVVLAPRAEPPQPAAQPTSQVRRVGIGPTAVGKSLAEDLQARGQTIALGRVTETLDRHLAGCLLQNRQFEGVTRAGLRDLVNRQLGLPAGTVLDPEAAAQSGHLKGLQQMVVISVDSFLDSREVLDSPSLGMRSFKRRLQMSCQAKIFDCASGQILDAPVVRHELVDTTDAARNESASGERLDELLPQMGREMAERIAPRVIEVLNR